MYDLNSFNEIIQSMLNKLKQILNMFCSSWKLSYQQVFRKFT